MPGTVNETAGDRRRRKKGKKKMSKGNKNTRTSISKAQMIKAQAVTTDEFDLAARIKARRNELN